MPLCNIRSRIIRLTPRSWLRTKTASRPHRSNSTFAPLSVSAMRKTTRFCMLSSTMKMLLPFKSMFSPLRFSSYDTPDFFSSYDTIENFWEYVHIERLGEATMKACLFQLLDFFVHHAGGHRNDG